MLVILDGWGIGQDKKRDALAQAATPYMDLLMSKTPNAQLTTFGEIVGLPSGQMGNSEVGHTNLGAGRTIYQDLLKVSKALDNEAFAQEQEFKNLIAHLKQSEKPLHLMGLLSDGGVHSHIEHLFGILNLLHENKVPNVYVHAFLDGRDTAPHGGYNYLKELQGELDKYGYNLATVVGRYYAMDRDKRWERTKLAYDLLTENEGQQTNDIGASIKSYYEEGITDEFMKPLVIGSGKKIEEEDAVFFFNFRPDRPRQITQMMIESEIPEVGTYPKSYYFLCMSPYSSAFNKVKVLFPKNPLTKTFGQLIAENNLTQLRIAETEKYPHVTYFFNGGQEQVFEGENRIMIPSPKVATYDLKPEMSAIEITDALVKNIDDQQPDFICVNYANTDMVGHTGNFKAAMKSAETVDKCLSRMIPYARAKNYEIIIIADHGNSDIMINEDGSPHTAHTTNPVPCIYIGDLESSHDVGNGSLIDIAPTLAYLMGIDKYEEMIGENLVKIKK